MRQPEHVLGIFFFLLFAACSSKIPARIDTVDGHQVEVATAGTGGAATVVFEAGLGNDWTPWDEVASQVARHARVFAYSRPGYGASDAPTTPRDPVQIVEELRTLLAFEHVAPPYLLVGHSIGGTYMELFAKRHPDEVVGVVLVDPRPRDFLAVCEAAALDNCGITESLLATQPPAVAAEYHGFDAIAAEIAAAGPFGAVPVRVLTATSHPVSPAREALWESMLGALAAEAEDGVQVMVPGSGHYIQNDRPEVVVSSIVEMLGGN
jgi:pimeloyl-ACP methyl ester carboxylesterase